MVGTLGNGEDVGRDLVPPLAAVQPDRAHRVDGEPLVRVDGDTEEAGVGLNNQSISEMTILFLAKKLLLFLLSPIL